MNYKQLHYIVKGFENRDIDKIILLFENEKLIQCVSLVGELFYAQFPTVCDKAHLVVLTITSNGHIDIVGAISRTACI